MATGLWDSPGSQEEKDHISDGDQKGNGTWLQTTKARLQESTSSCEAPLPKVAITLSSSGNWGPSDQTHNSVRDISHSNCNSCLPADPWDPSFPASPELKVSVVFSHGCCGCKLDFKTREENLRYPCLHGKARYCPSCLLGPLSTSLQLNLVLTMAQGRIMENNDP